MVPNNRAARLFIFSEFVPPTRLIWHYITEHKNTNALINFQGFCPTSTVIWTPRLFGTLEYLQHNTQNPFNESFAIVTVHE
jgi:hypothetical protein